MKYFFFISCLIVCVSCKSLQSISDEGETFGLRLYVDQLDQLYTVSPNNTIIKYDQDGKQLFEYSDNTLGPITTFDVTNPLQNLVFHENFQTIKIFDRTLTLNSQIDLNKLNLFEIHAVASSNDNRIWIFDELNQELLKIDKNGVVQGRNNDLRLRLKTNATPYYIVEFKNVVYLFDKVHGILIFNNFGEYMSQRPFEHPNAFRYLQGNLFYKEGDLLKMYNIENGIIEDIPNLDDSMDDLSFYSLPEKTIYLEEGKIVIKKYQ